MSSVREAIVEKKVNEFAKTLGILGYKNRGNAGQPDAIYHYKGGTVYIEFKQAHKKPRPLQEHQMGKIRKQGIPVYTVDDTEDGKNVLSKWVNDINAKGIFA